MQIKDILAERHGKKFDQGKPRVGLVVKDFPHALEAIAKVATYGANKYTESGWKNVENAQKRYYDAMHRHILEDAKGIEFDDESGLLHLAHVAWNILALLEMKTPDDINRGHNKKNNVSNSVFIPTMFGPVVITRKTDESCQPIPTGSGFCKCGNEFRNCSQCS